MRDYFSLHHHDLWLAETFPANFSNQSVRAWPAHRRLKQRGYETSTRSLYLHCPCASLVWHWLRLFTLSCVWFVGFSVFWRYKITTSLKYQIIVKKDVSYQTFSGYCEQKCFKTNKSLTFCLAYSSLSRPGVHKFGLWLEWIPPNQAAIVT